MENQDGLEWIIYYLGDNVGWALNRGHVPYESRRLGEQMDQAPSSAQEATGESSTDGRNLLRPRSSRGKQHRRPEPPPPKKQPGKAAPTARTSSAQEAAGESSTDGRNLLAQDGQNNTTADPNRQSPLSRAELSGYPHERIRAQPNPHTPDTRGMVAYPVGDYHLLTLNHCGPQPPVNVVSHCHLHLYTLWPTGKMHI